MPRDAISLLEEFQRGGVEGIEARRAGQQAQAQEQVQEEEDEQEFVKGVARTQLNVNQLTPIQSAYRNMNPDERSALKQALVDPRTPGAGDVIAKFKEVVERQKSAAANLRKLHTQSEDRRVKFEQALSAEGGIAASAKVFADSSAASLIMMAPSVVASLAPPSLFGAESREEVRIALTNMRQAMEGHVLDLFTPGTDLSENLVIPAGFNDPLSGISGEMALGDVKSEVLRARYAAEHTAGDIAGAFAPGLLTGGTSVAAKAATAMGLRKAAVVASAIGRPSANINTARLMDGLFYGGLGARGAERLTGGALRILNSRAPGLVGPTARRAAQAAAQIAGRSAQFTQAPITQQMFGNHEVTPLGDIVVPAPLGDVFLKDLAFAVPLEVGFRGWRMWGAAKRARRIEGVANEPFDAQAFGGLDVASEVAASGARLVKPAVRKPIETDAIVLAEQTLRELDMSVEQSEALEKARQQVLNAYNAVDIVLPGEAQAATRRAAVVPESAGMLAGGQGVRIRGLLPGNVQAAPAPTREVLNADIAAAADRRRAEAASRQGEGFTRRPQLLLPTAPRAEPLVKQAEKAAQELGLTQLEVLGALRAPSLDTVMPALLRKHNVKPGSGRGKEIRARLEQEREALGTAGTGRGLVFEQQVEAGQEFQREFERAFDESLARRQAGQARVRQPGQTETTVRLPRALLGPAPGGAEQDPGMLLRRRPTGASEVVSGTLILPKKGQVPDAPMLRVGNRNVTIEDASTLPKGAKTGQQVEVPKGALNASSLAGGAATVRRELDLFKDGVVGREISPAIVPNGNSAFQYALGRTEKDGAVAVFRRKASERGTYGGWRWETDASKLKGESGKASGKLIAGIDEARLAKMRDIGARAGELKKQETRLLPKHGEVSVGAAAFDPFVRGEALEQFLGAIRKGATPAEAAAKAKAWARDAVKTHNSRRPKDINWQRSEMAADSTIERAEREMVQGSKGESGKASSTVIAGVAAATVGAVALMRTDQALRGAVQRGEAQLEDAKTRPGMAYNDAVLNQQTRVLALAKDPDKLGVYIRSITDIPLDNDAVLEWAADPNGQDLGTWARNSGSYMNANLAGMTPAFLNTRDDDASTLATILAATAPLLMFGMVRGKSPRSLLAGEKAAETVLQRSLSALKRAETVAARLPNSKKVAEMLEAARTKVRTAQERAGVETVAGAKLAEMVGQPRVPLDLVKRMSPEAQRRHLNLRRDAINTPDDGLAFLGKYRGVLQSQGMEFTNATLDGINARMVAKGGLTVEQVENVAKRVSEQKLRRTTAQTEEIVAQFDAEMREVFGDAASSDLPTAIRALSKENVQSIVETIDKSGQLDVTGAGRISGARYFMDERNVAAFDSRLHFGMTLVEMREELKNKLLNTFIDKSRSMLGMLTDAEKAAMRFLMTGAEVPAETPYGPLLSSVRRIKNPGELRKGERLIQEGDLMLAVLNPNKPIKPAATQRAKAAAEAWREQVLDPLIRMTGADSDKMRENYFPRIYNRRTLQELADAELVDQKKVEKMLADPEEMAFAPHDYLPGSEIVWRHEMARKLPEIPVYLMDPMAVSVAYVRGAANKIAYDPVVKYFKEVLEDFPKGGAVREHFENMLGDMTGQRMSKSDQIASQILLGMGGAADRAERWSWAKHVGLHSLAAWVKEPGGRPGTKLFGLINALEFARKIGYSISTPLWNLTQVVTTDIASSPNPLQSTLDVFRTLRFMPEGQRLWRIFKASGMAQDQSKIIGSPDAMKRVMDDIFAGRTTVGRRLRKVMDSSGLLFQVSETGNTYRSFALNRLQQERGRKFVLGKGWVRGEPEKNEIVKNISGVFMARRHHFGGRINRAPALREPALSTLFQFNIFNWRMLGLLGNQFKIANRSSKRIAQAVKKGQFKTGVGENTVLTELNDNMMMPIKTLLALAGVGVAAREAGIDVWRSMSQAFGFVPFINERELAGGRFEVGLEMPTGPAWDEPKNTWDVLKRLKAALKDKPEELNLRAAEALAHFSPVAEVQLKRLARLLYDPRLSDNERLYILAGFRSAPEPTLRQAERELEKAKPRLTKPIPGR